MKELTPGEAMKKKCPLSPVRAFCVNQECMWWEETVHDYQYTDMKGCIRNSVPKGRCVAAYGR